MGVTPKHLAKIADAVYHGDQFHKKYVFMKTRKMDHSDVVNALSDAFIKHKGQLNWRDTTNIPHGQGFNVSEANVQKKIEELKHGHKPKGAKMMPSVFVNQQVHCLFFMLLQLTEQYMFHANIDEMRIYTVEVRGQVHVFPGIMTPTQIHNFTRLSV